MLSDVFFAQAVAIKEDSFQIIWSPRGDANRCAHVIRITGRNNLCLLRITPFVRSFYLQHIGFHIPTRRQGDRELQSSCFHMLLRFRPGILVVHGKSRVAEKSLQLQTETAIIIHESSGGPFQIEIERAEIVPVGAEIGFVLLILGLAVTRGIGLLQHKAVISAAGAPHQFILNPVRMILVQ